MELVTIMNNFTKEELEDICGSMDLRNIDRILDGKAPLNMQLIKKIQSMIDNYCDHENSCEKGLTKITDFHQLQ